MLLEGTSSEKLSVAFLAFKFFYLVVFARHMIFQVSLCRKVPVPAYLAPVVLLAGVGKLVSLQISFLAETLFACCARMWFGWVWMPFS